MITCMPFNTGFTVIYSSWGIYRWLTGHRARARWKRQLRAARQTVNPRHLECDRWQLGIYMYVIAPPAIRFQLTTCANPCQLKKYVPPPWRAATFESTVACHRCTTVVFTRKVNWVSCATKFSTTTKFCNYRTCIYNVR